MASCTPPPINPQGRPLPPGETLPVVETFHSLQGEGLHAGRSAFFIRLAGCHVGCPWCDTKHSWPEAVHPQRQPEELAAEARSAAAAGAAFVVITGGEPLHHDLAALCRALRQAIPSQAKGDNGSEGGLPAGKARQTGLHLRLPLHLETSGVDPLSGRFDWITLSPKRHRPPREALLAACQELKVVVHEPADLAFAEAMAAQAASARSTAARDSAEPAGASGPALLLQPGWNCRRGQELAVEFVRNRPSWRLSLQSHKWLGVR